METILTKALGEVLTPRWSEELRDAYDTGYKPSEQFETRMRELIRRTDRPAPQRYVRWLTAAAAVFIAVGAAVLVPVLMNNRIDTAPEQTSETIPPVVAVTTASGTDTSLTTLSTETGDVTIVQVYNTSSEIPEITDIPSVEIGSVTDTDAAGDITSFTSEINIVVSGTSDTVISDTTIPDETTVSPADTSDTTESYDTTVTSEESEEESCYDEEEYNDNEYEEILNEDDESGDDTHPAAVTTSETSSDDYPGKGADEYDDDDDEAACDDDDVVCEEEEGDVDIDDDEVISDDDAGTCINVRVREGMTLNEVFSENFGKNFNQLYAVSGTYKPAGINSVLNISASDNEYAFVQDFVHSLGSASADSTAISASQQVIALGIADVKPIQHDPTDRYCNYSAWTHYSEFFNTDVDVESDDEDFEDPVVAEGATVRFDVKVSADGVVTVLEIVMRGNVWHTLSMNTFVMNKSDTAALFDGMKKLLIPSGVTTVGDIANALEITSSSISTQYVRINSLYDTNIEYGRISADYIAGLFAKYRNRQLQTVDHTGAYASIDIYTVLASGAKVDLFIEPGGHIGITDGISCYIFSCAEGELEAALREVSEANDIVIPTFSTLGEYVSDKNLTELTQITDHIIVSSALNTRVLDDPKELKEVLKLLIEEAKTARYVISDADVTGMGRSVLYIRVKGWKNPIYVTENDGLFIRTNSTINFKLSDGFTEKLRTLFEESKSLKETAPDDDDPVVILYDDDDDEEIVVAIDDDENPLT